MQKVRQAGRDGLRNELQSRPQRQRPKNDVSGEEVPVKAVRVGRGELGGEGKERLRCPLQEKMNANGTYQKMFVGNASSRPK